MMIVAQMMLVMMMPVMACPFFYLVTLISVLALSAVLCLG